MTKKIIKETTETPYVLIDVEKGLFEISGVSFAGNLSEFYPPLLSALKDYTFSPATSTHLIFRLVYFNSVSQKYFAEIIKLFKPLPEFVVSWYYEEGDEDLLSLGKKYEKLFDIKVNFIEY